MRGIIALAICSLVAPLLAGCWGGAPNQQYTPTELASVSVPHPPNSLACSADGAYLVAGAWGWGDANEEAGPSELYVVDVATASVATTLKVTGVVQALAFSPNGKWLAVATIKSTWHPIPARPAVDDKKKSPPAADAVLVVFEVPSFTVKFTAKASKPENGSIDLAWAADGKALYAIDSLEDSGEVRRWDVPAFTEQLAIPVQQTGLYAALAVSPDGRTLAVSSSYPRRIVLFDLGKGTEQSRFAVEPSDGNIHRLGFTPDGKAIGILERGKLSWRDVGTGRLVKPSPARFALQPAGLNRLNTSVPVVSPDGSKQAHGYTVHRGLGDLGWDNRQNEYGSFVRVAESASEKTWSWRVGKHQSDAPAVAFFPDGTKLAGAVTVPPSGGSILLWAVPK
jgi:WD40 repeat protein